MKICDDLEGWDDGLSEKESQEERVCIQLIHTVVQQKLTQHCKAITHQLKKKKKTRTFLVAQW